MSFRLLSDFKVQVFGYSKLFRPESGFFQSDRCLVRRCISG